MFLDTKKKVRRCPVKKFYEGKKSMLLFQGGNVKF